MRRPGSNTSGNTCDGAPKARSDGLVVSPDLGVLAQHSVDRLEHLAHAVFRHRALDDDDQLRLVGRCADEPPGAVLDRHANAIDGDDVPDRLAGPRLTLLLPGPA